MHRVNVFSIATTVDPGEPPGYRALRAKFGPVIGAGILGGSVCKL